MSTDLEQTLRATGADLTLDHPVADVLARGSQIRRRRHRGRIVWAAGVLAVGGVAATLVGSGDSTSPGPVAPLRSSPEEQCRHQAAGDDAPIPDGVAPVLSAEHDGEAALVYRYDGRYAACTSRPSNGAWVGKDSATGPWRPMGKRSYRAYVFSSSLVMQVADDVDRVTLEVDGSVAEADVQGGYAVVWFPASATQDDILERSVVTAYDATGAILQQGKR
jgi:hypothetical protein